MNFDELCLRAKELASNGSDWLRTLHDDAIFDAYCELSKSDDFDKEKLEAAFVEGRREHRIAKGWIVCWTNACVDYDQFDTEELELVEWNGRPLRKVLVNPGNAVFQRSRYMSGAAIWDEDPCETERIIRERIAKDKAEFEEKRRIRETGLEWLRTVDDSKFWTDEDAFDAELRKRSLTWKDAREEEKRRVENVESEKRAKEWERCRAMFVDGCTIVDPGREATRTEFGSVPASDCAVYRNVRVEPHWLQKDNVQDAEVKDERRTSLGSLWFVAERLKRGHYRIAKPDEKLPPNAVLDRLRSRRLDEILRCEIEGRVVWVGCEAAYMSFDLSVLDEHGKLVRKKSIVEAAKNEYRTKKNYPF